MNNLSVLLVVFLLAGGTQVDGRRRTRSESEQSQQEQPNTMKVRTDIKGRLLTPDEGCGQSKVANFLRIVGGTPAKNGAWPWMVLLGLKVGWNLAFKCGGSLITSRHVLTAAHCLSQPITFARLGEYDTRSFTDGKHEDIDIVRKIPHEKWNRKLLINDIAILELARDVTFNDRIRPICLPVSDSEPVKSRSLTSLMPYVAGWGHMKEKSRMTNILQQVQVPVISNAECKEKYTKLGRTYEDISFSDVVLCAGFTEGGKDSCQGDSGGPMMIPMKTDDKFPFYQIGINSYGIGCARPNVPGVYTNVRSFVDWIQSKLQK